jgi:hypothetical protein
MIGSTHAVRVWVRHVPTDLHSGSNGLFGIVVQEFNRDPLDEKALVRQLLAGWDVLREAEREKDREVIRNIPALLAQVGRAVGRVAA